MASLQSGCLIFCVYRYRSESDVVVSHYDTLGVSKDATQKEVKDAYITLTKKVSTK